MSSLEYLNEVLNDVEGEELQYKNYVEYLRIFCPKVKNNNCMTMQNKGFYQSLRNDFYIQMLERQVAYYKWVVKQLLIRIKYKDSFFGVGRD